MQVFSFEYRNISLIKTRSQSKVKKIMVIFFCTRYFNMWPAA